MCQQNNNGPLTTRFGSVSMRDDFDIGLTICLIALQNLQKSLKQLRFVVGISVGFRGTPLGRVFQPQVGMGIAARELRR